jgi:hypothetical protein
MVGSPQTQIAVARPGTAAVRDRAHGTVLRGLEHGADHRDPGTYGEAGVVVTMPRPAPHGPNDRWMLPRSTWARLAG